MHFLPSHRYQTKMLLGIRIIEPRLVFDETPTRELIIRYGGDWLCGGTQKSTEGGCTSRFGLAKYHGPMRWFLRSSGSAIRLV